MTDRTWIYFVFLVLSLAVGGWLLREPVLKPYQALATEAEANRDRARELKDEIQRRKAAEGELVDIGLRFGEPLAPAERPLRATRFYRVVESLVLGNGLTVDSIQPKPTELRENGLLRFPVVVTMTGDLTALVALLSEIRSTTALIEVERLTIQRREDESQPLGMQITLVAYGLADRETRRQLEAAERSSRTSREEEQ